MVRQKKVSKLTDELIKYKRDTGENKMVRVNIDNTYVFYIHMENCPIAKFWMDNPGPKKIIVRLGGNPDNVVVDANHTGGWIEFPTKQDAIAYWQKKYPNYKLNQFCDRCR
jgi:hypothetical protein